MLLLGGLRQGFPVLLPCAWGPRRLFLLSAAAGPTPALGPWPVGWAPPGAGAAGYLGGWGLLTQQQPHPATRASWLGGRSGSRSVRRRCAGHARKTPPSVEGLVTGSLGPGSILLLPHSSRGSLASTSSFMHEAAQTHGSGSSGAKAWGGQGPQHSPGTPPAPSGTHCGRQGALSSPVPHL